MNSPAIVAGTRQMPGWLKGGLLAALVFAVCWGGAISYWRISERMPGAGGLAIFLLGLPLLLVLGFWFTRQLIAQRTSGPVAVAESPSSGRTSVGSGTPALAVLAASLRSPHGESPEELAAALAGKRARPDLDKELVDEDGFPVMTARTSDAEDETMREQIVEWLAQNGMAELRFSDEQWRALTLATAVVGELTTQAVSKLMPTEGASPTLQLVPLFPAEWTVEHRRCAGMWCQHTATQFGWPAARITVRSEPMGISGALTISSIFGQLAHDASSSEPPMTSIVFACSSNIGEETVADWTARERLFSSAQPYGMIPGEGAAGLLVTDLQLARSIKDTAFVQLEGMEEARLEAPAEARRGDSKLLGELADRVLTARREAVSNVTAVVADTDHRSRCRLELAGFASARMPQFDETDDVIRVGVASGNCGAVQFMTTLALAPQYVVERGGPVLCLSNEDSYLRVAALVRQASSLS